MSNVKNLICIVCPKGCHLTIDENMNVSGNSCKRGEISAKNEVTHPCWMCYFIFSVYFSSFTTITTNIHIFIDC